MALFPRLADCSHFHYENVSSNYFTVNVKDIEAGGLVLLLVNTLGNGWHVRRSWTQIVSMDSLFHDCIISRATTHLPSLGEEFGGRRSTCSVSGIFDDSEEVRTLNRASRMADEDARLVKDNRDQVWTLLKEYFSIFSTYTNTSINCAPILNFFEMDNHGYRLKVPDEETVNKPAVAAAQVVRRHVAQDSDEISLEVGEFVSIVDMPEDTPWWRAKQGMRVGFFPAECVSVIGRSSGVAASGSREEATDPAGYKAVALARGKTVSRLILALFGKTRPTKLQLLRSGILRDRVFGADLGVYLSHSRREVPLPLMVCAQIIEDNGVVDGIYRRSGAQTHVQALRRSFDEDRRPTFDEDLVKSDIHCFSSLLKSYFGELPTSLFSHTIYRMLRDTLGISGDAARLNATFRVLSRLPPPYFRTARYLFVHLNKMAQQHPKTLMTAKNLAICWAPNLMKPLQELDYNRPDPGLMAEVRDNPRLIEYIIAYAPQLFSDRPPNWEEVLAAKTTRLLRTGFNGIDSEQPYLLSLAEARRKFGCHSVLNVTTDEESTAPGLATKERARSMMVGPTRSDAKDGEGDGPTIVPSSPVLVEAPVASSSPSVPHRQRLTVLTSLQQKQQLIHRQQQKHSEIRLLSGSFTSQDAFRPRSHSLVESQHGSDLMNEMRQEHAKRRRRLKPAFSPGRRHPSRTQSAVGSLAALRHVNHDEPPPRRLGASVFYTRTHSVPDPEPPSSQPSPRRRNVHPDRSNSSRSLVDSPPRPPPPPVEPEANRSNFQRLQNSWQRRSTRSAAPRVSTSSSSSSSSASSSSSSSLTPPAKGDDDDGDSTPTGQQSPVMVVARAIPAQAPPPVAPRNRSIRSSVRSEPPEYENLETYRRLSGLDSSGTTNQVYSSVRGTSFKQEESILRHQEMTKSPPRPRPRQRHSHLDTLHSNQLPSPSPMLSADAAFKRNNPVRQSLPTRMDRLLTNFPNEVRCYLPETNV